MPASRFKTCRQISENVWQTKKLTQKQKAIILKLRKKTNKKQSDFSKELQTIQKLSLFYGKLPIKKMRRSKTQTYLDKKNSLLFDIERRLDVILVRLNFCLTICQARQLISHKKICVNYKMVNIPGFQLSKGDLISIQDNFLYFIRSKIRQNFQSNRIWRIKPTHLEVNYKTLKAVVLYEPQQIQFPYSIDLDLLD
uniref:Ribosomal protein S4 n=8 Tax=Orthotrichaceae TaxID=52989 RepID=A0A075D420_ORTST|nr:ribosomal protein S4 [Orthotrichum stellatum]YP_009231577.1 ribosomal protein S4 [Orthotrichum macrocephalum]YP_009307267.1 ribosomal protein S4 [Orthotrichum callistomum]YP_009307307.1 ribosomal protein S4 [Orthotrichum gymnostomum]YP_009316197.1 ribosomal protein S4 [Orthotrichum obtusifolium]YP_009378362.1 ribosomal protein S4 [Stoneobryum mirum]AJD22435.1 ribosomal protein S4 [Orthotrichum rogeri]AKM98621.1 ribosomal protein S4 [Orthotrichum pulchellum]AGN74410.1 ribosomal protein S4